MNLIFVVVTVLLLLVVAGIVLLVTSLERPQQGEILLRTGFGKTKFSSSPNSKLLCLPGLHQSYTIDNAVKHLQISNTNHGATDTADRLSVFYTCDCEFKVDISTDSLLQHIVEDNSSNVDDQITSRANQHVRSIIKQSTFELLHANDKIIEPTSLALLNSKLKNTGYYAVSIRIHSVTLEPADAMSGNSENYRYLEQAREEQTRQQLLKEHQTSIEALTNEIQEYEQQLSNQLTETRRQQDIHFQHLTAESDQTIHSQVADTEELTRQRQRKAIDTTNTHQIQQERQLESQLNSAQSQNKERLQRIHLAKNRRESETAEKHQLQINEELAKREKTLQQLESETESQMHRFQNDGET